MLRTAGKLLEAINLYGIAHEEDPTDSRPLANRSACWFERGAYDEAAMDSDRALSLVAEGERAKLLCRAGKAHLFAGHVDSAAACFSEAERTGGLDEACTRFAAALQVVDAAASIGPCELPVCRPAPVTVLEYYASSNERARSAFGGRVTRDDSGHHEEQKEDRLLLRGKQGVAAFFGGCGDGRHVMHTLMDAHEQLAQLSARERHDYKLALILNDHCPASLARVFVLLVLVEQFGAAAYRQRVCIAEEDEDVARGGEPSQRMTQLAKDVYARSWLLYYTQLGAFLPPALATALQEILATYSRGRPPRWIRCDERTWQSVQQILDAWANTPLTAKWMDRMYEPPSMQASGHSRHSPNLDPASAAPLRAAEKENEDGFIECIRGMPDEKLMEWDHVPGASASEKRQALEEFARGGGLMEADRLTKYAKVTSKEEIAFFDAAKVLPEPDKGASLVEATDLYDGPSSRLRFSWRPNPTLVDHGRLHDAQRTHGAAHHVNDRQPVNLHPFDDVAELTAGGTDSPALTREELQRDDRGLFDSVWSSLYVPCGLSLHDMASHMPGFAITLEPGDMHAAVERHSRAIVFDRCWLSNVPDYTSMLHALLYFVPSMAADSSAVMEHTLLLVGMMGSNGRRAAALLLPLLPLLPLLLLLPCCRCAAAADCRWFECVVDRQPCSTRTCCSTTSTATPASARSTSLFSPAQRSSLGTCTTVMVGHAGSAAPPTAGVGTL